MEISKWKLKYSEAVEYLMIIQFPADNRLTL